MIGAWSRGLRRRLLRG